MSMLPMKTPCNERASQILRESKQIRESTLREKLIHEGYTPCEVTFVIKGLRDYADLEFFPVMQVVDYNILRNGGL